MSVAGMPSLVVEAAFGYGPTQTPVWTDISSYARNCTISRGRSYELDDFEAGTCTLTLKNQDGRFDPAYSGGPYYGKLYPYVPLRVSATWSGTTYRLFYGFVERWPPARLQPSGQGSKYYQETTITAADAFALLANERFNLTDNGIGGGVKLLGRYVYSLNGYTVDNTFPSGDEALRVYALVDVTEYTSGPPATFNDVILRVTYTNGSGVSNRVGQIRLKHRFPSVHPHHVGRHPHHHGRHHKESKPNHVHRTKQIRWHEDIEVTLQGNDTVRSIDGVSYAGGSFTGKDFTVRFYGERALIPRGTGDVQLKALLGYYGWPASLTNITNTGKFTQLPFSPWDTDFLEVVRQIQDTELGQIYVDRSGNITFEGVNYRYNHFSGGHTWHDGGGSGVYVYTEVYPSLDIDHVATAWEVTRVSQGPNDSPQMQFAADPTSVARYGTIKEQRTPAVQTDSDALKQANYLLTRTKNAFYRIPQLTIRPRRDPSNLWPATLAMDISTPMTVNMYPPNGPNSTYLVSEPQMVEHVTHTITPDDWVTDLELSPYLSVNMT